MVEPVSGGIVKMSFALTVRFAVTVIRTFVIYPISSYKCEPVHTWS